MALIIMQIVLIIVLVLLTNFFLKHLRADWTKKVRVVDILTLFLIWFIYKSTLNTDSISKLPAIMLPWLIFSFLALLYFYFFKKSFNSKNYLVFIWRIADVYFLIAWIIVILLKLFL